MGRGRKPESGARPSSPDIVALGEPLVEFTAEERGSLGTMRTFRRGWGGDTSNAAVAAARLGSSVGYVTRLGSDEFGRSFLALWQGEGIDTSRVVIDSEAFTGVYFVAFEDDGVHDFTYYRQGSAASRLRPADLDPDYLGGARVLHVSGITQAISESCRQATQAAIATAKERNVSVSYDANVRPKLAPLPELRETFESTVELADIVFVSDEDLRYLYGDAPVDRSVEEMLTHGPRMVVVKTGDRGCRVMESDGGRESVPAFPVRPVDTTGAGDSFDAGFLVRWLDGSRPRQAAEFANAVAALTSSGLGAVEPIPTRAQVDRFLAAEGLEVSRISTTSEEG